MKPLFLLFFITLILISKIHSKDQEIVFPIKHSSALTSLKYSKDKQLVATSSNDWTIKLWFASNNGALIRTFSGHGGTVLCFDFSYDKKYIASGSSDSTIIIWDLTNGKNIHKPLNLGDKIYTICFNPNNKSVFAGTNSGKVYEITILTGKIEREFSFPEYKVTQISFTKASNKILVSLSKKPATEEKHTNEGTNSSLILIDLNIDQKPFIISNYKENISNFCFNPDSQKIVTAADNGMVRVWNANSFIEEVSFKNTNLVPGFIFVSGNGKMIGVSGQKTNTVNIWRISGEKLFDFTIEKGKVIYGEFNIDITRIHLCNDMGRFIIYDLNAREREQIGDFLQSESNVTTMALSPLSEKVALGYKNGMIRAFDLSTSIPVNIYTPQNSSVLALCFSKEGKKLCVSNDQYPIYDENNTPDIGPADISIIETATGLKTKNIVLGNDYTTAIALVGNSFILGYNNGVIKFYDAITGKELSSNLAHDYDVVDLSVSKDGKWLATSSTDASVKIWKIEGFKLIQSNVFQFDQEVTCVNYILSSKTLITATKNREITIMRNLVSENATKITLTSEISSLDISESDSLLFASYYSGQTECSAFDINTGKEMWSYRNNGAKIMNVIYSEKYKVLFCGLENGLVKLLNPLNGNEIATLIVLKNNDWLVYTPDNYFDSSMNVNKGINIIDNLSVIDRTGVDKYCKKDLLNIVLNKK